MKDNFSTQSDNYAKFRPGYPSEFFDYLYGLLPVKETAWDCATGNGQVASQLCKKFRQVYATDISQSQLDNAVQASNIFYSVQPAEKTSFSDREFDLVVVAQAIHWFDFEKFYDEVRRTAKRDALICVLGYGGMVIDVEIKKLVKDFYENVVGPYWDPERKYIDANYETIPFPFKEVGTPAFETVLEWSPDHLLGYLGTWSAVKHFIKKNGSNPLDKFSTGLAKVWKSGPKTVRFPLLVKIGRVH